MGVEPIRVELTDFNKLALLRDEEERLAEELAGAEKSIRDIQLAAASRDFLATVSPYYAAKGPGQADLLAKAQKLEAQRQAVCAALDAVKAMREALEQALGPAASRAAGQDRRAPRAPGGAARNSSFDSFEEFRQTQQPKG